MRKAHPTRPSCRSLADGLVRRRTINGMLRTFALVSLVPLAGWAAGFVVESAREIPVTNEVNVLVNGGTAAGVSAAKEGAKVFLAGGFMYLGEDVTDIVAAIRGGEAK